MASVDTSSGPMSAIGTNPRRRRPPVSCSLCRQRKIKCNRESPCSNCIRVKNEKCVYQSSQPPRQHGNGPTERQTVHSSRPTPAPQQVDPPLNTSNAHMSPPTTNSNISTGSLQLVADNLTSSSTPISHSSGPEIETLRSKIKQLENQLARSTKSPAESPAPTPVSDFETTHSHLAGTFHVHNESLNSNQGQTVRRSFIHKRRLFGQSHWISSMSLFRDIVVTMEQYLTDEGSKALLGLQKCKHLGRKIKAQRTPQWPVPITTDLPPKNVCDALVDCYLRTFEKVYRVLHVPSFIKDYDAFWQSEKQHDPIFLVHLKLVLAIGCTTFDDKLSLRYSAIRFIYEAQTWLAEPEFKARLGIPFLQAQILLLVARELLGVDGGMIWIAAGTLIRTAVYMGLHRDPLHIPHMSKFVSEMNRRLWNTVLEICLQYSMESGGPPLISTEEFDTQPPANIDDDDLTIEQSMPNPENRFTSASIAIALRKTFPIRLAILKFLNAVGYQGSYEEAISLDSRLRSSYKQLRRTIQQYLGSPPQFEILMLDLVIRRYLLSIHIPFFGPSFLQSTYAFSRNVVIDTAAKIFNCAFESLKPASSSPFHQDMPPHLIDFRRLTTGASGLFRTAPLHSSFLIAVELRNQILEEEGLGPVSIRPYLLSVLQDAKTLHLRCIEIGETNIKGYLFMSLVATQIDALMQGATKDQISKLLVKAAEEAEDKSLSILERIAMVDPKANAGHSIESTSETSLPHIVDDWDFMMADAGFNFADTELPSWMLGNLPYGIP